ncbi:hypothetical protein FJM67_07095 [Maribrevibacterium harenarium]|uniref:Uncharacterized protein n=1 Tax=Maribrevibacterium harenarium TaxID=2589817 RepID=A0A501WXG7_9GAMM|nr:DUF6502 family protein [Maribrevibacterium harenarium]TPE53412.1 hypothetical protein FJM67_07095 [Maribrevibacterium harenarium]
MPTIDPQPTDDTSQDTKQLIAKAMKKVLGSLVRLLLRQGIDYGAVQEWLKQAFVEETRKELERRGEKVTLSRISVISGVHRKDVKRLSEIQEQETPRNERSSITSRLVSLWLGDSQYLNEQGQPKCLSRSGEDSFDALVESVSKDVRPRTILDDWLQRGLISGNDQQGYELNAQALYPSEDQATKVAFFARNTADHIAACEHNLRGESSPFPERSVFYNHLSKDSVDELQQLASEQGQALLIRLNKRAQELARQDDAQGGGDHRFILGTYFYREQERKDDA